MHLAAISDEVHTALRIGREGVPYIFNSGMIDDPVEVWGPKYDILMCSTPYKTQHVMLRRNPFHAHRTALILRTCI
jgi:hypothetical protein